MAKKPDPEVAAFEAALLQSVEQMQRGEYAKVRTPEQLQAIKARAGRPAGAKQTAPVRVATTLRMRPDALARWRASGKGWQTRAAEVLAANAP